MFRRVCLKSISRRCDHSILKSNRFAVRSASFSTGLNAKHATKTDDDVELPDNTLPPQGILFILY